MSFERIRSFLRTASEITEQPSSFLDKTSSFISNSFRRASVPQASIAEFEDYLASLPIIKKQNRKIKSGSSSSLRPELVKRCMENVEKVYFDEHYQIDCALFDKRIRVSSERDQKMKEQLDEVELCLFNQNTSRFDQILSVLRTVESLDCLVVENQRKLKTIREGNFRKVMAVSQRQNKMALLIRHKKNLESVLQISRQLREFEKFDQLENNLDLPDTMQEYYSLLPNVKANLQLYKKFRGTRHASERIEEMQGKIRRSFSDKVNQKIFQYLKRDIPYQPEFWRKCINARNILEEREDKDNTALLDESTLMGEEESCVVVVPRREEATENAIVEFMRKGWEEGEYSIGKLKNEIDTFLKSKHNAFILDFRNFCDEICKKHQKEVENPSLTNLLKQISITFCAKVDAYFFDIHKSVVLRFFSLSKKVFAFLVSQSQTNLSIQGKQKITLIAEGFTTSGSFLIRMILEQLVYLMETKGIHECMDIAQIKQAMGVLDNAEAFLKKQVQMDISAENSFLAEFFQSIQQRYPIKIIETVRKRKLLDYLNKIHRNAMTVQLKESLEKQPWVATDIPTFYYDSLHYLITGESLNLRKNKYNLRNQQNSMMFETSVLMDGQRIEQSFFQDPTNLMGNFRIIRSDITINGQIYKVTETLLLLLEMLQDYMTLAQNFPMVKAEVGVKINELLRYFNTQTYELIVKAGAISYKKIKSKNITSRHLALSSLCLKFILYIMDCIGKRIEIMDVNKLTQSIEEHFDTIVKKLNQILMVKANSSKPDINLKDTPSKGTETIVNCSKILQQITSEYYNKDILAKIFSREFQNVYIDAISGLKINTRVEAEALKDDVNFYFTELKFLETLSGDFDECRLVAEDVVRRAFQGL